MFCSLSPNLDVNDKDIRSRSTAILERLVKLLENHLYWSLFVAKFPTLVMSVTGIFLQCHEIFKNIFAKYLRMTAIDFSVSENETF